MNLLTKILNQRPEDPLSILESLNRTTQYEWFHPKLDTLQDDPEMQPTYEMAEKQKALFFRGGGGEGEQEMEEEVVSEGPGQEAPKHTRFPPSGTDCSLEWGRGRGQVPPGFPLEGFEAEEKTGRGLLGVQLSATASGKAAGETRLEIQAPGSQGWHSSGLGAWAGVLYGA